MGLPCHFGLLLLEYIGTKHWPGEDCVYKVAAARGLVDLPEEKGFIGLFCGGSTNLSKAIMQDPAENRSTNEMKLFRNTGGKRRVCMECEVGRSERKYSKGTLPYIHVL